MANTKIEFSKNTTTVSMSLMYVTTDKISFIKDCQFIIKPGEKLTVTVRGLLVEKDPAAYFGKPAGFGTDAV